jgi:hypothetical protein
MAVRPVRLTPLIIPVCMHKSGQKFFRAWTTKFTYCRASAAVVDSLKTLADISLRSSTLWGRNLQGGKAGRDFRKAISAGHCGAARGGTARATILPSFIRWSGALYLILLQRFWRARGECATREVASPAHAVPHAGCSLHCCRGGVCPAMHRAARVAFASSLCSKHRRAGRPGSVRQESCF